MTKTKNNTQKNTDSLSEIINPIMNYLISIENEPVDENNSHLIYTMGVPRNWIMETDCSYLETLKVTDDLKLIKLEPFEETSIDEFFRYIVTLINKNLLIDTKRAQLEEQILILKSQFNEDQKSLMDQLYNTDSDKSNNNERKNKE